MKRISALLLAALLLFILAACGEDSGKHDKTFTIIVGGEDVWTPFDGNMSLIHIYLIFSTTRQHPALASGKRL